MEEKEGANEEGGSGVKEKNDVISEGAKRGRVKGRRGGEVRSKDGNKTEDCTSVVSHINIVTVVISEQMYTVLQQQFCHIQFLSTQ